MGKKTEKDYAGWLKDRHEPCTDNDAGMNNDSNGQVQNCAAAAAFCQDRVHGQTVQKNCMKTCSKCTEAPTVAPTPTPTYWPTKPLRPSRRRRRRHSWTRRSGLHKDMLELDDAVAGLQ